MNQQESPDMDKAQEEITFITPSLRYTLHLKPEWKGFRGNNLEVIPAKLIRFEGGKYSTDDPEEIKLLRACKPFRRGKIKEITESIRKAVSTPVQKTVRGAITSATLKEEAGAEKKPQAMSMQEQGTRACPDCDYVSTDDFSGRKMQGHKMGKHRLGMRPKPEAPSKKLEEELGEAKKGLKELKVEK